MPIKVSLKSKSKGEIEIYGYIGEGFFVEGNTPKKVNKELKALGKIDQLDVRINSGGGSVFDGMAIYNLILNHRANVTVYVDGLAASMASIIAMAGDEIIIPESALLMIHNSSSMAHGNAEDLRAIAEVLDKIDGQAVAIYAEKTGLEPEEIEEMLAEETWMTGSEALEKGFATETTEDLDLAACADMTKYKFMNAPDLSALTTPPLDTPAQKKLASAGAQQKEMNMPKKVVKQPAVDPAKNEPKGATLADFQALEKTRREEITAIFGAHAGGNAELLATCLNDMDCTPKAASKKLLEALGAGIEPSGTTVVVGESDTEKFFEGATNALAARAGIGEREADNEFNGMRITDLAARCITRNGGSVRGLSADGIARKILGMSSSDFPGLTSNLANKTLRDSYEAFETTWQKWCEQGEVSDFKVNTRMIPGSFGNLVLLPEGAEYQFDSMGEDSATIQAVTKGKAIRMTRQMIVNDDLGAFVAQGRRLGRAAARTVNADAFAALAGLAPDGTALFHADHSNLAGSGTAITIASVSAGKAAMRLQKDADGNDVVGVRPSYLLVPVALEDAAMTFITSETDPSKTNSKIPNIHRGTLEVISDPYLDGVSATAWFLVASANSIPMIEVAFLDGNSTPFTDEDPEFLTDSLIHKVRLDYGVGVQDYRGGYKDPGA